MAYWRITQRDEGHDERLDVVAAGSPVGLDSVTSIALLAGLARPAARERKLAAATVCQLRNHAQRRDAGHRDQGTLAAPRPAWHRR
jgi:hypothetical protein